MREGRRLRLASLDAPIRWSTRWASSITDALNEQHLGFLAERIRPGDPTPSGGWLVKGRLVSVDPGNRALRAVVGFGAGDATTEVTVEVDSLGSETPAPLLRFGTHAESSKMPGGAVTMNPYASYRADTRDQAKPPS